MVVVAKNELRVPQRLTDQAHQCRVVGLAVVNLVANDSRPALAVGEVG